MTNCERRVSTLELRYPNFRATVAPGRLQRRRWMIHLQGLRRPPRRLSAVFCLTVSARRLRRTTSTTVPPVPSQSRPGPAQRRPPCPIRHAEARSRRSREKICTVPVRGPHSGSSAETGALWRSSTTHQRLPAGPVTSRPRRGPTATCPTPDGANFDHRAPRTAPGTFQGGFAAGQTGGGAPRPVVRE